MRTLTGPAAPPGGAGPPVIDPVGVEQVRDEALTILAGPRTEPAWAHYRRQRSEGIEPDPRPFFRLLGARGLLAPAWPVAYGGRGLTPRHQAAVVDALVEVGVSETLHTLSVQICGNFLLAAGSRAQRATMLPDLAAGRRYCAVLYSEPDVGSDLAALTTRAVADPEGGWRLSGRKVYSVKTSCADLGLVAARTAGASATSSRYHDITLFCVPLNAPGILVRPLWSVADEQFADVILTDVWVAQTAVIGPVGGAWPLITGALALERTGVDYHAKAARWLALWREYADSRPGGPDHGQLVDLGRLDTAVTAARLFADWCLDQLAGGHVDPVLAATAKLWCADTARDVAWWCTQESGPAGLWRHDAPEGIATPGAGRIEAAYREAPGLTISAGTSEMMLELLSSSGLPTPDGDLAGFDEEPLVRQLRTAIRAVTSGYDERDEIAAWWAELAQFDVFALAVPADHGGLGLGLPASVVVCEELGRGLLDAAVLDTLTAVDALVGTDQGELDAALAGRRRYAFADARSGQTPVVLCVDGVDAVLLVGADSVPAWHPPTFAATTPTRSDTPVRVLEPTGDAGRTVPTDVDWLLSRDRIRRAAWLVGLAGGALTQMVRRARTRRQFGRVLVDNQSVAFGLARLAARVSAGRLLVSNGATELDAPGTGAGRAAGTLAAACELAYDASRQAMQVFGAYGMTDRAPAQRHYRAAMVACGLAGPVRALWREAASDPPGGAEHGR